MPRALYAREMDVCSRCGNYRTLWFGEPELREVCLPCWSLVRV